MRAYIFLVAMSMFAAGWLPAPASADCDGYNERFLQFKEIEATAQHELERVNALKPLPKTDEGLCHAALELMTHGNSLWESPEPTCFENKAQTDEFVGKIHSLTTDAIKVAQLYCTEAEIPRP